MPQSLKATPRVLAARETVLNQVHRELTRRLDTSNALLAR
jgi:hypothetical protein